MNIFSRIEKNEMSEQLYSALFSFNVHPNLSKDSKLYQILKDAVTEDWDSEDFELRDDLDIHISILQAVELFEEKYVTDVGEFGGIHYS